jgi:hypothetical protein
MQAPDTAAVKKQQTVDMRAHADESVPGIVSRDGASKGKASSVVVGRVVGDTLTAQQAGFADDDGNLTRSINALSVDRDRSEMYEVGSAQLVGVRMGEVLTRKRIVIYPAKLALMIGIALLVGGAFGALIMVLAANDEGDTGQSPVIIQPTSQNSLNSSPPVAAIQCDPGRSHCVKPPPDLTKGNRLRCGAAACEYQYTRISGARVKDLTRQDKFPNKPDKVIKLTSGGFSSRMRGDKIGVMMEGFVMAPMSTPMGLVSFSTRSDDQSEVWVAAEPDTQTTLMKMVELTSCCKKVVGSRTVVWLRHRTYYIRYLVAENEGYQYGQVGMKVMEEVKHKSWTTRHYFPIPISMFRNATRGSSIHANSG